jgi:hypothetical protein
LRALGLVRRSFPDFALPPRRFIRFTPPHLSSSYRPNKGFWKIIGRVRYVSGRARKFGRTSFRRREHFRNIPPQGHSWIEDTSSRGDHEFATAA